MAAPLWNMLFSVSRLDSELEQLQREYRETSEHLESLRDMISPHDYQRIQNSLEM